MSNVEIFREGCPNCGFLDIEETEVGDDLYEFDCVGCGYRWLSDQATWAEVERDVAKWRADEADREQIRRIASLTCPDSHPRSPQYPCADCTDQATLAWVEARKIAGGDQ